VFAPHFGEQGKELTQVEHVAVSTQWVRFLPLLANIKLTSKLAKDEGKHSSLFIQSVSDKEKSFMALALGQSRKDTYLFSDQRPIF
jgi:hypothetical protein